MSIMLAADGSSLFMRALHVLPEDKRTAEDLEYMVVSMFRKALRFTKATHAIFMCDTVEAGWRHSYHPSYKGDRTYDGLKPRQLTPILRPLLEARGIPCGYLAGMEADDLLRGMVEMARPETELYVYTKDGDLYGVLSDKRPNVRVLWPGKEGALEVVSCADAEALLGYDPQWVPMVRALTADRKDNIRGLFGDPPPKLCAINQPRAVHMLKEYSGDLWALLEAAAAEGEVRGMRDKEKAWLVKYADEIGLAWHICVLRPDAKVHVDPRACAVSNMNLRVGDRDE